MRDMAASVHQRLLNIARAEGRPFNELLQYFALERFLYRLGRSPHRHQYVLKGALMLAAWDLPSPRPTRDIDLLGYLDNTVDNVVSAIKVICHEPAPDDGLQFAAETVVGERITEAAEYEGVRIRLTAHLGTARIPMRIDVGFGDPLVPGPALVSLPTLLPFPRPELRGYSRESMIAEKLHAMVYLGEVNSRMKDFYDVWLLATRFEFDGPQLSQAIRETFQARQTDIPLSPPVAFTDRFARNPEKVSQWRAFVRRHRLDQGSLKPSPSLTDAVQVIARFLHPVLRALTQAQTFHQHWSPAARWESPTQLT